MPKRKHKKGEAGSVGRNVQRAEGVDKVTGRARYLDDLRFPGMLYGATVRSSIARGRILSVERDPGFDWSGFTFVDASDVPGKNHVAMIVPDQPILAQGEVNHREEPIALVAHADRARLAEALAHVTVRYQPLPAVLDLEAATEVMKEITIVKGDVAAGLAESDVIVEGLWHTGHQEQLYIETNGVIAVPPAPSLEGGEAGDGGDGGITIYGSMQCPFYVVRALATILGLPSEKVRVIQTTTGGGFGGKEEFPSVIAAHAALLARKAGRPVKMVYERAEDMVATTKRHPSTVRHRTGLRKDGTLVAMDIDVRIDGGAYVTLTPVVLSRAAIHATGPYHVPNVRIVARALRTHTPPNGAFRGFGAPQSQFAAEMQMDRAAEAVGLSPVELRRRNLLKIGDVTATGQRLDESVSAHEVLDRALALASGWQRTAPVERGDGAAHPLRGVGVATYFHGSGFTGGGEVKLASKVGLELTDGGVRILVASTEIGQGTRTMHAQIVADTLGIPYEWVETGDPDTARVPDSGPTVASRTCMVVGRILQRAALDLRQELGAWDDAHDFRKRARRRLESEGPLRIIAQYQKPGEIEWSDETYRGSAYGAYAWGANVAEVEVDPVTFQARCTRLVSVVDVGKAIHPQHVEGQIEGGSLQAVGWALLEDVVMREGRMANGQLTNYIIPTTLDTPEMIVGIVENPYRHGPFGAKGVGEAPMDGPAPAILAAIRDAVGARLDRVPATPERIMEAMRAGAAGAREVAA
jgi:CO/xanthine dehydrogenase Mo-binding subunit